MPTLVPGISDPSVDEDVKKDPVVSQPAATGPTVVVTPAPSKKNAANSKSSRSSQQPTLFGFLKKKKKTSTVRTPSNKASESKAPSPSVTPVFTPKPTRAPAVTNVDPQRKRALLDICLDKATKKKKKVVVEGEVASPPLPGSSTHAATFSPKRPLEKSTEIDSSLPSALSTSPQANFSKVGVTKKAACSETVRVLPILEDKTNDTVASPGPTATVETKLAAAANVPTTTATDKKSMDAATDEALPPTKDPPVSLPSSASESPVVFPDAQTTSDTKDGCEVESSRANSSNDSEEGPNSPPPSKAVVSDSKDAPKASAYLPTPFYHDKDKTTSLPRSSDVTPQATSGSNMETFKCDSPPAQDGSHPNSPVVADDKPKTLGSAAEKSTLATLKAFQEGDRVQVQWELEGEDPNGDHEDEDERYRYWWGATVHQVDDVATSTVQLRYEAYPNGGFPDESVESVTILGEHDLRGDDGVLLHFRLEGSDWEPDAIVEAQADDDDYEQVEKPSKAGRRLVVPLVKSEEPPEVKDWRDKQLTMISTYTQRATTLWEKVRRPLPEESFDIPLPPSGTPISDGAVSSPGVFPDSAVGTVAALIEGKSDPLSVLSRKTTATLNGFFGGGFTEDMVGAKIKVLATRKHIVKAGENMFDGSRTCNAKTNVFEDLSPLWRWEVESVTMLPTDSHAKVKKARSVRRKLSSHLNALVKLITALKNSETVSLSTLDSMKARISQEEERVLKFEREAEKSRQEAALRLKKEQDKIAAKLKRQEEKKQQEVEKKRKKDEAALQKQRLKMEAANEKEKQKQKVAEERQRKREENQRLQREKLLARQQAVEKKKKIETGKAEKQSKALMSFFVPNATASVPETSGPFQEDSVELSIAPSQLSSDPPANDIFDVDHFRSQIGANEFPQNDLVSRSSAKRSDSSRSRVKMVVSNVYVTVYPETENPFESQPYSEQQQVTIRNKFKFFRFHEDVRPPYFGTWSKHSSSVSGRTPLAKDSVHLDYEYDSEAEWEEGDDEDGESLADGDEADNEEDKKACDEPSAEDEDGWLADDDDIDDDLDEESKALRKEHLKRRRLSEEQRHELTRIVIPPSFGRPFDPSSASASKLEGIDSVSAGVLLQQHTVGILSDEPVCLDAFTPCLIEDTTIDESGAKKGVSQGEEVSIVKYIHQSTHASKDKMVDDLLSVHPTLSICRSQVLKIVERSATKTKLSKGEICWKVSPEVLTRLGLNSVGGEDLAKSRREDKLRLVANSLHAKNFASKEKAVDELRGSVTQLGELSRAECMRLLETVALKRKHDSGVIWEVKTCVAKDLGLDLPSIAVDKKANTTPPKITAVMPFKPVESPKKKRKLA